MEKRRFSVTGIDDLGDVHVFLTDNRQRAEGVAEAMREELEPVDLTGLADATD
jgi:hypothetical protein